MRPAPARIWTTLALALWVWLPLSPTAALAQAAAPTPTSDQVVPDQKIVEIRVEGNHRVEREAIVRALAQKQGQLFDPTKTADDLRGLFKLGFFSDVELLVQHLPEGIAYVVRVQERPVVHSVELTGNEELSKDDFKETLDIKPNSILDLDAVRRNAKKISDKYVDKGYFLAEVTWRIDPVPGSTNDVDIVFVINEHSKVQVRQIHFVGNEHIPADQLKEVMATKEAGFLSFLNSEGNYREEIFQRDVGQLQSLYWDRGFVNVKVDKPVVSLSADKRYIYITLRIDEGEQYKIGTIDFTGDLLVPKEELAAKMVSRSGELFNRSRLFQDIQSLTDVYQDQGYAYANINPGTQLHEDNKTVDVIFNIQKGHQVTIERIEITGNAKTRDKVIRREMRVYEGELFSGSGLRRSRERVTALGFFETVDVAQKPGSTDDQVVVTVDVKEKATGTFQVGLGFSNAENFVGTAQISQNNFLGWGNALSASAQISGLRSFLQFSYFDPYFLDTNYIASIDLYRVQADFLGFVRNSTGGTLNAGYHILEDVMANVAYTREYVQVEASTRFDQDVPLANRNQSGVTSSVRASLTWDKRDNRLFPSRGFLHFASVEYAPSLLGGTFLFTRYSAYSRFYVPLPFGLVFKTNATVGYIAPLDAQKPIPISELYYLGGINTVRGYFLRSITPTVRVGSSGRPDASTQDYPVGGDKQFMLNVELEFPIFEKVGIRGVLFYDDGNAWSANEKFFEDLQNRVPLGLFHSVGFGFRWFSPIGPLRFEWGIPLNRRPTDQSVLFEFTIGNFF